MTSSAVPSQVYVHKDVEAARRWRRWERCGCRAKDCTHGATFVQHRLGADYAEWQSAWCDSHVGDAAARRALPVVRTTEQYSALLAARRAAEQAAADEVRRRHAEAEAQTMRAVGHVLRLSGSKGKLVELPDGSLTCLMHDGTQVQPCCGREAARIIDNRIGGRTPAGHAEDCPTLGQAPPARKAARAP